MWMSVSFIATWQEDRNKPTSMDEIDAVVQFVLNLVSRLTEITTLKSRYCISFATVKSWHTDRGSDELVNTVGH